MSLARRLKGRIRRSGIGVFPKRSCVLYVPSTRAKRCCMPYVPGRRVKEVLCYMPLAQGFKRSYVLYVPSTKVHESIPVRRRGFRKRRFLMEVYRCVRLDFRKKSLCENMQVCPAWFSKMILIVEAYRFSGLTSKRRFERIRG